MSRIGKKSIVLNKDVNITLNNNLVEVKGPKGTLSTQISKLINISLETRDNSKVLSLAVQRNTKEAHQLHGLSRTLISNMVTGVQSGFQKHLEIRGVGYRSQIDNGKLVLNVGYSHPVIINPPEGIHISVENNTNITIKGNNKCDVGQIAAKIRSIRPPEPYKGKGIRYKDEFVKKKVGKAGK
uniref:Large ribosomal subunit protein uL6c n=1 Tax=Dermonema virens TaxID=1077399 RepID=A0A1G4NRV7_9FLOR|nr:Ribosomal protein L6 [Dermonema virens]SCW21397.1 Ribosomal protein L6 [Dermonema virens]